MIHSSALLTIAGLWLFMALCAACGPATGARGQERIALPTPNTTSDVSLEQALLSRRSVREYGTRALTLEEIGQLAWAAQGITSPEGFRTAPSAGALYPLELYVVLPQGVYHYRPAAHELARVKAGDFRDDLGDAAVRQRPVYEAPAVFVIAAVYERTAVKYGERAERYVHLEAGHAAQNLLLQAAALDLGAVPIGAFYDERVQAALGLAGDQAPLYLIPVGPPRHS